MTHVDPELLALLALGERAGTDADRRHLDECPSCLDELRQLRHAAAAGRTTLQQSELAVPHPRVWRRVAAEAGVPTVDERARPWWSIAAIAAAAVLVVVLVTTAVVVRPPTTATAELQALPGWSGATGTAEVRQEGGRRVLSLSLNTPAPAGGYREVWLISSDSSRLVSLGVVGGDGGDFVIPDGLDLRRYDLVDVSAEPVDGDPGHSGDSIVRGPLIG